METIAIQFRCLCGTVVRAPSHLAGRRAKCPKCARTVLIPGTTLPSRSTPSDTDQTTAPRPSVPASSEAKKNHDLAPPEVCSFCNCVITRGEGQAACPVCRLPFHLDCWKDNLGCSAYGCSQVGILSQEPEMRLPPNLMSLPTPPPLSLPSSTPTRPSDIDFPWDFAFLGLGVLAFLLSVLAYGLPSLACGAAILNHAGKQGPGTSKVVYLLSGLLCLTGFFVGLWISFSIWRR